MNFHKQPRQKEVRLRYVPDIAVMGQSFDALAPQSKEIICSALPNDAMPGALRPAIQRNRGAGKKGTAFFIGFEYDGARYMADDGHEFTEGQHDSGYQAGHGLDGVAFPLSERDAIHERQHMASPRRVERPRKYSDRAKSALKDGLPRL